jgi:4'-phosphopantetheinyl transferase
VHFSLAHSGDAVVIAVASQSVGVDVEQQPSGCVCALSGDMNAADAEWGRALGEAARHDLVIRWWVRAEAVLKCTGEGIGHGIGSFPVLGSPDGPPGPAVPGGPEQLMAATVVHGCSLISLPAPGGYQAALALAGQASSVRLAVRAPWSSGRRRTARA